MWLASRSPYALALALFAGACQKDSGHELAQQAAQTKLDTDTVAVVDGDPISVESVERIVQAQNVTPQRARELAISDAVFAAAARRKLDPGSLRAAETSAAARRLLEEIQAAAKAKGAPSAAELDAVVAERWYELERPASVRTIHAVVIPEKADEEGPTKALAERIAKAVKGAKDAAEFRKRAQQVPATGLSVRVEELPPVTSDGRVWVPGAPKQVPNQRFDARFAQTANQISEVGEQSPVVESAFGYHVIQLLERLPEQRYPRDELRQMLKDEIITRRARQAEKELLESLQRRRKVEVMLSADDLTARVQVKP